MTDLNKLNINEIENIIYGRAVPQIYAFSTETIPNYLKIGDTYRPLEIRLNEWRKYFPNLIKQFVDIAKIDEDTFFRDLAVHLYLENDLKKQRLAPGTFPNIAFYSKEFFKNTTIAEIQQAVIDIKQNHNENSGKYQLYKFDQSLIPMNHTYLRNQTFEPRPIQEVTVKKFKNAVDKGRNNLLMYAVMRFGKSFTSLCCANEIDAKIVVIVSAKADVKEEWKKTTESHIKFESYEFIDSDVLLSNEKIISQKIEDNKNVVVFLTLQDLQGNEIKNKHAELFNNQIDLLIIDETHFGARASEYGKVLHDIGLNETQIKDELKIGDSSFEELEKSIKFLNSKTKLHLSGTPYRVLMGSEFTKDDIIAFYQFTDIADLQAEWNDKNLLKDDVKEWDNPYYGFPQMIRFAFNPNQSSINKMEELKKSGVKFAFSALFKPKSIKKNTTKNKHKEFEHSQEILELLEVIDGSKNDNNLLGFLDYDKIKEGKMCRHIVCVLPYRASCDALENLIQNNLDKFSNLSQYKIINIAGVEDERTYKDTQIVKKKIKDCEKVNKKTLTLTVNRMLTGSTVEEWDTMLYFKDTASPQEYDQAVFRIQNQYINEFKDKTGDTIKYNMKPQTLLVDFDPNRMFLMQEHKAQIYNVNTAINGNLKLEERIKKELQISPIITINSNKLVQVQPSDILDAVRQYSNSKSILDEAMSIPVDFLLLNIEEIKNEIEKQEAINSKKGLEIKANNSEEEGDDLQITENENQTEDEIEIPIIQSISDLHINNEQSKLRKQFATYYSRILFFAFLTNHKIKYLYEILELIKTDQSSQRLAKNLEIKLQILDLFNANLNPYTLSQLEYKIHNINSLANDPKVEPIERAGIAMNKFSRLSSSEIVTPTNVVDKMLDIFPNGAIKKNDLILDIASKQGEFVYGVYKKFGKDVANNFYSIPTSKIGYEFTMKVYELLELDIDHIEQNYNSYNLIKPENNLIKNNQIKFNNKLMNFNTIVGNPPYQESISDTAENSSLSKQIFPSFIELTINLNPDYLSLITPSRWFTGDAQDKSFLKLRKFVKENNHFSKIVNSPFSKAVFQEVEISGGVNFFLFQKNYNGLVEFMEINNDMYLTSQFRPLFEKNLDIILSSGSNYQLIQKIKSKNFKSLTEITKGRDAFGIVGKNINSISSENVKDQYYELRCKYEEIRFIEKKYILKNLDIAENWKIFISKGNGGAGLLTDGKPVSILGKPYIGKPKSVCTDSLIPIGLFKTEVEANCLLKYIKTRFFRYTVGLLKVSQNVSQNVYKFVPLQDFTKKSDIDWSKSIPEIDQQLYNKYSFTTEEISFIESMIKPMNN
jgi:Eco57I restriction-modification methylase/Type III restriction enzyme, res subunit